LYSILQLTKKYIGYYLTASNGKGHGVHSPFVFDFIKNVLRDGRRYDCYASVEAKRQQLLADNTIIEVEDFGAGSTVMKSKHRPIQQIAASSLKPKKFAQLLFRMVRYYQPETVLELGTSLGITTAYLSAGNPRASVYTCEGAAAIATVAKNNFTALGAKNIQLTEGDFAQTLSPLLQQLRTIDFAFIDGNHRKDPTIAYFMQLLQFSTSSTILVFDDIHWSEEMEAAWQVIKDHEQVTLTIDLFFIGLVFINPDFKVKQHFSIRF